MASLFKSPLSRLIAGSSVAVPSDIKPLLTAAAPPAPAKSVVGTMSTKPMRDARHNGLVLFHTIIKLGKLGLLPPGTIEEQVLVRLTPSEKPDEVANLLMALRWRYNANAHHLHNLTAAEKEALTLTAEDVGEITQFAMLGPSLGGVYSQMVTQERKTHAVAMATLLGNDNARDLETAAQRVLFDPRCKKEDIDSIWQHPEVELSAIAKEAKLKRIAEEELEKKRAEQAAAELARQQALAAQALKDQEELDALVLMQERSANEELGSW